MPISEIRKTRDRSSFLSNPSFDMSLGAEETFRRNYRQQQEPQDLRIPPTPAPTQEFSDASSSISGEEDEETQRTIEIYEESVVDTSEVSSYFHVQQEKEKQQRPSCLNYINFLMWLANATVAFLMGPAVAEVYDQYPTLITPADFCFSLQGILYVSQFLWAISQIFGTTKHHPLIVHGVGWCYFLTGSCQIAWYFLFSKQKFIFAMVVHSMLAITLLWMVSKRMRAETNNIPEYLTLQFPFDLQAAWVLGTCLIQASVTLVANAVSSRIQMIVALASLVLMAIAGIWCLAVLRRNLSARRVIPLVILGWICLGMASAKNNQVALVEHFSSTTLWAISLGVTIVAAGLLLSTILFVAMVLRYQQDSTSTDTTKKKRDQYPKDIGIPSSVTKSTTEPSSALIKIAAAFISVVSLAVLLQPHEPKVVHLAMIGNSMMYYNDLPRLLEAMSARTLGDNSTQRIIQDSCLHGGADFGTHLESGNGMFEKWKTGNARIWDHAKNYNLYDWGACTPEQLLLGYDARLESLLQGNGVYNDDDNNAAAEDQDGNEDQHNRNLYNMDDQYDTDDTWNYDDRITEEFSDINPCHQNGNYYKYYQEKYGTYGQPKWDYVLMNDDTRSPCCTTQRESSIDLLKEVYIPMFLETGAIPIFMMTYGYWASARDMSGLQDVPTFTSYNYAGYRAYAELAAEYLPASQKPRIAPVGLAFLLIWEEKPNVGLSTVDLVFCLIRCCSLPFLC